MPLVMPWCWARRIADCAPSWHRSPRSSGFEQDRRRDLPGEMERLEKMFSDDARAQLHGASPRRQPVVGADPAISAVYNSQEAMDFSGQPIPVGRWRNDVALRSPRHAGMYEPGTWNSRVSPSPLLMICCHARCDHVRALVVKACGRAHEPKNMVMIEGGHLDPYVTRFAESSAAAIDWFATYLRD